jgi:hypothetical protein
MEGAREGTGPGAGAGAGEGAQAGAVEGAREGTGAGAAPGLRRASLTFFTARLEERLRGVIPAFAEWRERLLAAHQLPTDWRATCIRQAVEEAIPLVSGDQGLELELFAWLQVIADNEVCPLDFWCYRHTAAFKLQSSVPVDFSKQASCVVASKIHMVFKSATMGLCNHDYLLPGDLSFFLLPRVCSTNNVKQRPPL